MTYPRNRSFANKLLEWSSANFSEFSWRRNRSPYEILIAEVLLKRTTATAAARVYDDFVGQFPSLSDIEIASPEEIAAALSSLGLQHQRANSLKRLAHWILNNADGEIPSNLTDLLAIPGLGGYSAAAILSFGYNSPIAILDTNVERILTRVFQDLLPTNTPNSILNELAQQLLPHTQHQRYNYSLLDLGRNVCRYVDPKCPECPVASLCDFYTGQKCSAISDMSMSYELRSRSKLRIVRIDRKLSLQRLADISGISKSTIINTEAGRSSPTHRTLIKLAAALNVHTDDLV